MLNCEFLHEAFLLLSLIFKDSVSSLSLNVTKSHRNGLLSLIFMDSVSSLSLNITKSHRNGWEGKCWLTAQKVMCALSREVFVVWSFVFSGEWLKFVTWGERKGFTLWPGGRERVLLCDQWEEKGFYLVTWGERKGFTLWHVGRGRVLVCDMWGEKGFYFVTNGKRKGFT